MTITNHRLDGAEWAPTRHVRGEIDPTLIVLHGTGTRIDKGSAVRYCQNNKRKVSYHIIIERDGSVVQLAPMNRRVNHAGRSSWKGRQWCNSYSIAIGLVDPGELRGTTKKAMTFYREWMYEGLVAKDTPQHGKGWIWLPYTPEQLAALDDVVTRIRAEYPGIDIAGHYQVSPGRKIDPTPLLDISAIGNAPVPVAAPAPEEQVAQEDAGCVLAKNSREYKAQNGLKGGFAVGGLVPIAALGAENVQATKTYLDMISSFIAAYGATVMIAACVAGWAIVELIQHWKREAYDAGDYEPSGLTKGDEA